MKRKINWVAIILLAIVFYLGMCFGNWYTIKTAYPINSETISFDGQLRHYK